MVNVLKGHAQLTNTSCKIHGNIQEIKYVSRSQVEIATNKTFQFSFNFRQQGCSIGKTQ